MTDWYTFFFMLFALIACIFGAAVLFTSNIVRMAFFLTLSLGATAGLFFLAGATFVGAMQLMIYVGGTLVLLIFGVMLTAQARFISMRTRSGEWVAALVVGGSLLALLLSCAFGVETWRTAHDATPLDAAEAQTATALGAGLSGVRVDKLNVENPETPEGQATMHGMSGYLLPFIIISVHLLVVLVGAAFMARGKVTQVDTPPRMISTSGKMRHPTVALWLCLMLFFDLMFVTAILFDLPWLWLLIDLTGGPSWLLATTWLLAFVHGVSLLAIFSWQRWGFYGVCVTALLSIFPVAIELGFMKGFVVAVVHTVLTGFLYWLLHWGDENSVWTQLEP